MPKSAPEYELVLMLDPEAPDERREEIVVEARKRIESDGTLKQERSWGLRKMAYEIDRRNEADYRFFRFEKGESVLDDLNHNLRITDGVLRFRIFKVDARAPVIDPPPPISLAATATERPGGRGRRDDRGGGRYEERPPRGPEPEPEASAGEGASAPAPEVSEAPAPEASAPAEAAPPEAPAATEAEASAPEAEASPPAPEAPAESGSAPEAEVLAAPAPDAPAEPAQGDGDEQPA